MSDPLSDTFRANVRAAMELRGMSQKRLSARMGAHPTFVNKQLTNPRGVGVTLTTVARFAQALDIEPAVLLTPGGVQRSQTRRVERAA